jgi:hypothetical protein
MAQDDVPMFTTGIPTPDESHVQQAVSFQKNIAQEYRTMGQTVKADEILAGLKDYEAQVRNDLGVPLVRPDPVVEGAREFGVELKASPDLYRDADVRFGERTSVVKSEMGELMASMQLDRNSGVFLLETLSEEAPRVSKLSPEERDAWVRQQEEFATEMATRRGSTLEEWKAEARKQLQGTPLGRRIAESFSLSSVALLATLADARLARKNFEGSKK